MMDALDGVSIVASGGLQVELLVDELSVSASIDSKPISIPTLPDCAIQCSTSSSCATWMDVKPNQF